MSHTRGTTLTYTRVDEAPALATGSLLPIIRRFVEPAGIAIEIRDISLAGRILARFPEFLTEEQRVSDDLEYLRALVRTPEANLLKLPNISASVPQLIASIRELQDQGYPLPDYPVLPRSEADRDVRARYDAVKGSAVNPVLREGNSDRRLPSSVKTHARKHPHPMGEWSADSRSHVAHMAAGDFRSNESSLTVAAAAAGRARIEWAGSDGSVSVLNENVPLQPGAVVDVSFMSRKALRAFLEGQIDDARKTDVLFSIHLKATMMKVSDPIIFGHALECFYGDVFEKHAETFSRLGFSARNGLGDLEAKLQNLPDADRKKIEDDLRACGSTRPKLAMVNSDKGITNLHVPSDVIVDASMPAAIRSSGRMWGPDGALHDTKFVIPDASYAGVYRAVIDFCKQQGAFDPKTMGTVSNIGLMAAKAEEYGSHDTTFEAPANGIIRLVAENGETLLQKEVVPGDIWRLCRTTDEAVRDWVKLAVSRARATGWATIFWLDKDRPHDAQLIRKVERYLKELEPGGLDIRILSPEEAARLSCQRLKEGENTISVTGNVLRDYLTDLFPILEVGTSAKMLSIVPLINGGGLFETGAGGSAPRHVQQFLEEGHLRWDSLGEFLALAASLEHLSTVTGNRKAKILADALDNANSMFLENNRSPSRSCGEIDTRGSHFYWALYWAHEMAAHADDTDIQDRFSRLARGLDEHGAAILEELLAAQGRPVNIGGYYRPDPELMSQAMRPSETFNRLLADTDSL